MIKTPISRIYAKALLDVAVGRNDLETVQAEVEALRQAFHDDKNLQAFLVTPGIVGAAKKASLERVFSGKLSATVLDFLCITVVEKGRARHIGEILDTFIDLCDERLNRLHVEAVTAAPMAPGQAPRLTAALGAKLGKVIVLHERVDPDVLGGLVFRFGDWVVDGSIRTQLKTLSHRIRESKPGSELVHEDQA